jgi:Flp pilus assembly protein TadD
VNPGDTQALVNLGISLVATGDIDGAVSTFQRVVDGDPSNQAAKRLLQLALTDKAASAAARR